MIDIEEVLKIHNFLIDEFGGSHGLRDQALLESALSRPFATFSGEELYKTPVEKSAAIFESIVKNHPFQDGNKRIAYVMLRLVLMHSGLDIVSNEEEKYEFVIKTASGELTIEQVKKWINDHLKKHEQSN
ncbi:type II toxin-antitoxin system death-on-curing family toxin [Fulvivirgaceae bacterium BMA12]|uniref:Type II toxin-antitoxin system death-on-curing family toxin n=1 Tax=Agaribacillus aureus TaxID=3051825 RepID=A0ABT8L9E1_9BACT|nr:type II toxin-antitoxin system death-on-curing family toxin [Fulvivirgaceae bacterium BMA12]